MLTVERGKVGQGKRLELNSYIQIWREIECRDNTVSDSEKNLLKF